VVIGEGIVAYRCLHDSEGGFGYVAAKLRGLLRHG
jgi:hypothetical protein